MFREDGAGGRGKAADRIAIVDERPAEQFLYPNSCSSAASSSGTAWRRWRSTVPSCRGMAHCGTVSIDLVWTTASRTIFRRNRSGERGAGRRRGGASRRIHARMPSAADKRSLIPDRRGGARRDRRRYRHPRGAAPADSAWPQARRAGIPLPVGRAQAGSSNPPPATAAKAAYRGDKMTSVSSKMLSGFTSPGAGAALGCFNLERPASRSRSNDLHLHAYAGRCSSLPRLYQRD